MDTGTAIIGIVMIIIVTIPFILTGNSKKKTDKELVEKLKAIASQEQANITQHTIAPNLIIGIDKETKLLFLYKEIKEKEYIEKIDLHTIKSCQLSVKSRNVKSKGEVNTLTTDVGLIFSGNTLEFSKTLVVYNSEETFDITNELSLAKEWEKIVQTELSTLAKR